MPGLIILPDLTECACTRNAKTNTDHNVKDNNLQSLKGQDSITCDTTEAEEVKLNVRTGGCQNKTGSDKIKEHLT